MNLSPVTALELHATWPSIRANCAKILEKTGDRALPEDIYAELRASAAFLYMIELAQDEVGFVVLRKVMDPDGPALFMWLLYADPGVLAEQREPFLDALDKLARGVGAKRIRGYSPRDGFFYDGAFKLTMHVYEREV